MKKRSNITLLILLLLLLSIPFAAYFHFRHLVHNSNPATIGDTLKVKANDKDSVEITFNGSDKSGFHIKTAVRQHQQEPQR